MSWSSRVSWTEGMFLRPQHFQQETRFLERLSIARARSTAPYAWGFSRLRINRDLLAAGQFGLLEAAGAFPDGAIFDAPDHDPAPASIQLDESARRRVVYLTLPARSPGVRDIGDERAPGRHTRAMVETLDVATDATPESAEIEIAQVAADLRAPDPEALNDALRGRTFIPIARVADVRADGAVILDDAFAPSVLDCGQSRYLTSGLEQAIGLCTSRAKALAARVSAVGRGGTAEIADFLLLQIINRYTNLFRHFASTPNLHPSDLYGEFAAACGELAAYSQPDKLAPRLPDYAHDDIAASFGPTFEAFRRALEMYRDPQAIRIDLIDTARPGIWVADVGDKSLFSSAQFVLAMKADAPSEDVRRKGPAHVKIGGVDVIRDLIDNHLPGVRINPLPVAPRQLPYHYGKVYFELERAGDYWRGLTEANGMAIFLSAAFQNPELELWAIRDAA